MTRIEARQKDYELKLTYRARSSKGVRFKPGEGSVAALPLMLEEFARTPIELVDPREPEVQQPSPPGRIEDDVRGLHVPVQHATLMGVL